MLRRNVERNVFPNPLFEMIEIYFILDHKNSCLVDLNLKVLFKVLAYFLNPPYPSNSRYWPSRPSRTPAPVCLKRLGIYGDGRKTLDRFLRWRRQYYPQSHHQKRSCHWSWPDSWAWLSRGPGALRAPAPRRPSHCSRCRQQWWSSRVSWWPPRPVSSLRCWSPQQHSGHNPRFWPKNCIP